MSRTLIERYWAAQDPYDGAALRDLRHKAWFADWPQSAERIPSHEADVAIHESFRGYPAHHLERVGGSDEVWRPLQAPLVFVPFRLSGASDIWVSEFRLDYPDDGRWYALATVELREGLVARETVYYCRTFDTPPWPASYVDSMPVPSPTIRASMEHNTEAEQRHQIAHKQYGEDWASDPEKAVRGLFHETAVIDRPQAGRRVAGRATVIRVHEEQRDLLPGRIRRVVASGDVLLAESQVKRDDDSWFVVSILEFDGDKVARATEYLAEGYEAPESRRAWTEQRTPDG